MMDFWLVALIMVLIAVAFLIIPMVRPSYSTKREDGVSGKAVNIAYFKEQSHDVKQQINLGELSEYDARQIYTELEKKLLNDIADSSDRTAVIHSSQPGRHWIGAFSLLIPVLALFMYLQLGAETEIKLTKLLMNPYATSQQVTSALEAWSEKRPDNAQALYMLGGRYLSEGDYPQAEGVFVRLYNVTDGSPEAAAELAQVVFLANNNTMTQRVRSLYEEALLKDDTNMTALGLRGIDAFGQEDYHKAITAWRVAAQQESDPLARQSLITGINRARRMLGEVIPEVRVNISLAPEFKSLPYDTRVIVFARQPGVKAPLAALPLRLGELPKEVVLDESSAMMMGASLDGVERVDVVARISLRGDVSDADYQAEAKGVAIGGDKTVHLLIAPSN